MLSKEDIIEYQKIYQKVFGQEISYVEALEQGNRLLNFFKVICQPIKTPNGQTEKYENK